MDSSHNFTPRCLFFSSFGAVWVKLCTLSPSSLDRTTVAAVSSRVHFRNYKCRFDEYQNYTGSSIFGHSGCVHSEGGTLDTSIVVGPIERHKSRLAPLETGNGLTGTPSEESLERAESVPKWSPKHRAYAGLKEASQRDKVMRSMPPVHPERDGYRFLFFCGSSYCLLVKWW